jgi:hypothetical protein
MVINRKTVKARLGLENPGLSTRRRWRGLKSRNSGEPTSGWACDGTFAPEAGPENGLGAGRPGDCRRPGAVP